MKKGLLIFALALLVRFLYFPQDIYFAFDQARDSYISLEILKGDFKILGPPSAANPDLFAGALIYYIYAPVYFLFSKSPEAAAAVFRIFNALGVFLVFAVGSTLFNKRAGIISALLFAVSYETSQYSLFLSHQALAVVTVLLFYWGLSLYIFKNKQHGLYLAALGAGLSIQSHYVYLLLLPIGAALLLTLTRNQSLRLRPVIYSALIFLLAVSTYIMAELKFNFRFLKTALATGAGLPLHLNEVVSIANRFLHDNLLASHSLLFLAWIFVFTTAFWFFKKEKRKLLFLSAWFLGSLIPYFLSGTPSYYYAAAVGVSLFILVAAEADWLISKRNFLGFLLVSLVLVSNLYLITRNNPQGVNRYFVIQTGMLLSQEKRAIDYIYEQAGEESFAVGGLTIPLSVNTTWSYLFEWYGAKEYGQLPLWIGPAAEGYPGNLDVISDRATLPKTQFLIIEPTVGIREPIIEEFFREENYFTEVVKEKTFGTIRVQKRERI